MRSSVVALAILLTLVLETKSLPGSKLQKRGIENWELCPANEEWTPCGRCAEPTCDMLHPQPCYLVCSGPKSFSGCRCTQGLVRMDNQRCVTPDMCIRRG